MVSRAAGQALGKPTASRRVATRAHHGPRQGRTGTLLLAATAMITLSACSKTHLAGYTVNTVSSIEPQTGMGYALPATVFDVTVTRKLAACEGAVLDAKVPANNKPGNAKFITDVAVVTQQIAGDHFTLDYRKLGSSLKTSSLKLETYPNGTLKSVNAEVTDHGPEVAASVLKSVAAVARIALGLPPGGGVEPAVEPVPPELKCSEAATKALAAITAAKTAVQQETAALEVTTDIIKTYSAQRSIGTLAKADHAKLNSAMETSAKQEAALAEAKAALDKTLAAVTATETITWPRAVSQTKPDGSTATAYTNESVIPPSAAVTEKLKKFVSGVFPTEDNLSVIIALRRESTGSPGMKLVSAPQVADSAPTGSDLGLRAGGRGKKGPDRPDYGGLFYRMPGNGRLQICAAHVNYAKARPAGKVDEAESDAIRACSSANRSTLLVDQFLAIPQFGQLYMMPLFNGWGQDNILTGSWRADGSPEAISYQEKKATAVAVAGLAESAVTAAVGIDKDVRARNRADEAAALADKAASQKAELDALDQQINVLKKQKELSDLKSALAGNPAGEAGAAELASINADTALINANKARLQAQLDFMALQAKLPSP